MATKYVYFHGKAKYCRPYFGDQYGNYHTLCYLTPESQDLFNSLGIKNQLKKDEDGVYASFKCATEKTIRGKRVAFAHPIVVDADGNQTNDTNIGDGSDITVKCDLYDYKSPMGEKGKAIRWTGMRINTLVPFIPAKDYMDVENKQMGAILEQEVPSDPLF